MGGLFVSRSLKSASGFHHLPSEEIEKEAKRKLRH